MTDLTRYAILDTATGAVVNITMLDPAALHPAQGMPAWSPGVGLSLVAHETAAIGWQADGGTLMPPTVERLDTDLYAYAADKRWRVETGGISVGGVPVATDRESQSLITGAHAYAQINPGVMIKYKSGAGFVDLEAATVAAIATAVAAHVQACFATEADVAVAIERGDVLTLEDVDAWPWP